MKSWRVRFAADKIGFGMSSGEPQLDAQGRVDHGDPVLSPEPRRRKLGAGLPQTGEGDVTASRWAARKSSNSAWADTAAIARTR